MPTISDLRLQAATIKNATQVGENTANRVGTTFETIADLLEQQGAGQGVPSVDLSQLNTLRTPADQTTANPTIYNVTTLHNLSSTTIKVGTLFIFSDGGRAVVTQILLSNYQVDGGGNISSPNTSQITMYYRMFNIVQDTWSAWTLYGGGGGGETIDPYPVSGSNNAVESNGVFEGLQKAAPEVDINDIDDLDDYINMQTGEASTYTIKAYHNLSSTWLRVGVLMVFANQAQNTLTQICISNCMVDGGGNLIPNYTTNAMNVFYRFKQFSGNPPEGMTIGVWTTWAKFGDSGYQPDNEDIDLNASDQLQFANKLYDASAFSGLGRVFLRKNIVTSGGVDKNVLTQAMMNTANTIYHIQYDYDLNGQTITLPAGCVLEFDGGSVCNGLFVGDKMKTDTIYTPEMFGAGKTLDDTKAIQSALNICKKISMNGDYNVYSTNEDYYSTLGQYIGLIVPSNTIIYQNGTIRQKTSNTSDTILFLMYDVENVSFIGHGKYVGSVGLLDSGVSANEYNHCFEIAGTLGIEGSSFITIEGGEIFNFYGDCINIKWRGTNHDITIKNVELHHHGRASIAISGGYNILIENIYTHDWVSGITAKQDVSLETHVEYNPISSVTIKNSTLDLLLSNTNSLQSYFYGIQVIDSCINTVDMLSLYSDSIISNNKIVTKCRIGSGYTPSISNCEISGYIDLFHSVRYKGCTATGLFIDSSVTDFGQHFLLENCTFTFTPEAGNNKAEMYIKQSLVDNLVMENSTILWVGLPQYPNLINGTFNRCNLSFYDNVTGSVKAFNSKIDIKLLGSDNYVFNANIKLEKCNIHVGSRYIPLYNLNKNYVINQYSIVEDDAFARKRTANNGTELVDNYTIYKSNNIFEDEYIDVGEDSLIPSIITPQKVQYEYDNTVLGNTKLTLRLVNDYTRIASVRNTTEYVANSISKDTIIRIKVVQYNIIPTIIFAKTNNSIDDGIQVPFVLSSGDSNNAKGYSSYFRAPDPAIYPYIYVASSYAGYTIFYVAKYVMRWEYGNGYMAVTQKGTTSERPTTLDAVIDVGFRYFDITLNKPIYWNGTAWVDATGAVV